MITTALFFSIALEIIGYLLWIKFTKDGSSKKRDIVSAFMFILAIIILYQIFKLNLDFGLILLVATFFAAFSWLLGKYIDLEELRKEIKYQADRWYQGYR